MKCTLIFQEVDIRGRSFDTDVFKNISLQHLAADLQKPFGRPVRARKINDLKKLMPSVPLAYRSFYKSIVPEQSHNDKDSDY